MKPPVFMYMINHCRV